MTKPSAAGVEQSVGHSPQGSDRLHVLLADDHAMMRAGLRRIVEGQPDMLVCGEAHDGPSTLQQVRDTVCDLLLLDLSMPAPNGVDLIRAVRRIKPLLPILVLSMHDKPVVVRAVMDAGASGYLSKGSDAELLVEAMRQVAAGQTYVEPRLLKSTLLGRGAGAAVAQGVQLSKRERQVMERLLLGQPNHQIAQALFLSEKTVSTHKMNLMRKLGVNNLVDLARVAERWMVEGGQQAGADDVL